MRDPAVQRAHRASRCLFSAAWQEARHPRVADAASELLRDVFGDDKLSSRLVFGVASLPLGVPVELEVIFEVRP
jgi:enamine deaminase RidA (YjgF/YER057c/UK114 family)